jgi:hypothetical protein
MSSIGFDTAGFLRVARELATRDGDEAALRTAVGRAYYACFLLALRVTGTLRQRDFHEQVLKDLGQLGHPQLASQLGSLRRLREVADYQPAPRHRADGDWNKNWRLVDRWAEHLISSLETLLHPERT